MNILTPSFNDKIEKNFN